MPANLTSHDAVPHSSKRAAPHAQVGIKNANPHLQTMLYDLATYWQFCTCLSGPSKATRSTLTKQFSEIFIHSLLLP